MGQLPTTEQPEIDPPVVLITGASSGIGEALALEWAKRGASVVLAARRVDRLESLAARIAETGREALAVECDVTSEDDLKRCVAVAVAKFGRIDTVVANAGFGIVGNIDELEIADYERQFDTNIYGVIRTIRATLPELEKSKGRIAIISSVLGYFCLPGGTPYAISKFAMQGLGIGLRHELRPRGISVTLICPGMIASEIRQVNNSGRFKPGKDPVPAWILVSAEKAAREIVRAVEARKRERVISFHGKVLVFFQRHFPGLVSFLISSLGVKNRKEPER